MFWNHYEDNTVNQANLDGSNPMIIASDVNTPGKAKINVKTDMYKGANSSGLDTPSKAKSAETDTYKGTNASGHAKLAL